MFLLFFFCLVLHLLSVLTTGTVMNSVRCDYLHCFHFLLCAITVLPIVIALLFIVAVCCYIGSRLHVAFHYVYLTFVAIIFCFCSSHISRLIFICYLKSTSISCLKLAPYVRKCYKFFAKNKFIVQLLPIYLPTYLWMSCLDMARSKESIRWRQQK